jgi:microcystin-dependent protein
MPIPLKKESAMRHFQKSILPVLMIVVMILLFGTHSIYAAPGIMNYQGTLTDTAGLPVSATKTMIFKIYATISDTTTKWTSVIQSVVVKNGNFSVNLGEQDVFPAGLFDNDSLFLGVTVDGVELTPRKRLASVPYAISAGSGGIPMGGIIMWSGSVVPTGWALCDGQNGTPDLRNRFVVGAGTGSIYAIGATGGNVSLNLQHNHTINDHNHPYSGTTTNSTSNYRRGSGDAVLIGEHNHTFSGTSGSASDRGTDSKLSAAQDILPPYYALAFIIKL